MPYTPGEVADKTGFSIDTLRYYERIGLLDDIARTPGGQRAFTDDDVVDLLYTLTNARIQWTQASKGVYDGRLGWQFNLEIQSKDERKR